MAFEPVTGIHVNYDGNICDWQSTSYQAVLGFQILLTEMFSNSISLRLMEN